MQPRHQLRQDIGPERGRYAQPQRTGQFPFAMAAGKIGKAFCLGQHAARGGHRFTPERGEYRAPAAFGHRATQQTLST
jgi:L-amino acid N-acyltransferase YncA